MSSIDEYSAPILDLSSPYRLAKRNSAWHTCTEFSSYPTYLSPILMCSPTNNRFGVLLVISRLDRSL